MFGAIIFSIVGAALVGFVSAHILHFFNLPKWYGIGVCILFSIGGGISITALGPEWVGILMGIISCIIGIEIFVWRVMAIEG